jgi:hypothetical protein
MKIIIPKLNMEGYEKAKLKKALQDATMALTVAQANDKNAAQQKPLKDAVKAAEALYTAAPDKAKAK